MVRLPGYVVWFVFLVVGIGYSKKNGTGSGESYLTSLSDAHGLAMWPEQSSKYVPLVGSGNHRHQPLLP